MKKTKQTKKIKNFVFFFFSFQQQQQKNRAEGGELQKVLDDEESIDERQCRRLIRQIIEGIRYLHQKHIAHLDIKVSTVCLDFF